MCIGTCAAVLCLSTSCKHACITCQQSVTASGTVHKLMCRDASTWHNADIDYSACLRNVSCDEHLLHALLNGVCRYELLDEAMDNGYPQLTDPTVLKSLITQKGYKGDLTDLLQKMQVRDAAAVG